MGASLSTALLYIEECLRETTIHHRISIIGIIQVIHRHSIPNINMHEQRSSPATFVNHECTDK
jgi:hypothetical protein